MARFNTRMIDGPRFAPTQPSMVALPRQNQVRAYLLRVVGSFMVAGGSGAGEVLPDALWRLLRTVQYKVGGRDVMVFSGQFLAHYLYMYSKEVRIQTPPAGVEADKAYPFELLAEIPLDMLYSSNSAEFGGPTAILPNPELVITWGTAADLVKGVDGNPTLSDVTVELYEESHDNPTRDPRTYRPLLIGSWDTPVTGSGKISRQLSSLIAGDEIRSVFVEALSAGEDGTGYEYDSELIEKIRMDASGRAVREEVPFSLIQQENVVNYALDEGLVDGVAVLEAAPTGNTGAGAMWTVEGQTTPAVHYDARKQGGECKIRTTVIYARGRLAQG